MSNVNLLPYDYFARRLQQRMTAIFVVLFVIIMTCVIVASLALERNARRTLQAHGHIRASYEEAARLIELMQRLEAQRATMLNKAKLSAALLEKVPRSYLLAFVTNARPENVSLTELEIVSCRVAGDRRASGTKRPPKNPRNNRPRQPAKPSTP